MKRLTCLMLAMVLALGCTMSAQAEDEQIPLSMINYFAVLEAFDQWTKDEGIEVPLGFSRYADGDQIVTELRLDDMTSYSANASAEDEETIVSVQLFMLADDNDADRMKHFMTGWIMTAMAVEDGREVGSDGVMADALEVVNQLWDEHEETGEAVSLERGIWRYTLLEETEYIYIFGEHRFKMVLLEEL